MIIIYICKGSKNEKDSMTRIVIKPFFDIIYYYTFQATACPQQSVQLILGTPPGKFKNIAVFKNEEQKP